MSSLGLLRQILAFSVCVSLITPQRAHAELPPPRLWLSPTTHDGNNVQARQLSSRVIASLKDYLSKSKRFAVEDGKVPKKRLSSGLDERVSQAETYKYSAFQAFNDKKYEEAEKTLKLSIKLYQASIASVTKLEGLYQALALMGATYSALEYDGDAKDFYRQLAAVAPDDFEFPKEIPSKVKKRYEKERKNLSKKKSGALLIETSPEGAQVTVDGVERCVSPCEVKGLLRGAHYVQVKKDGEGQGGSVAKVKAGYATPLKYTLTKAPVIKQSEPVSPEQLKRLNSHVAEGKLNAELRLVLEEIGTEQEVEGVLVSHLVKLGSDLKLFSYLYVVDEKKLFWVEPQELRPSLSAAKVATMKIVSDLESIVPSFPAERVIDEEHAPFKEALALSAKVAAGVVSAEGPKPMTLTPPTPPVKAPVVAQQDPKSPPPPSNPSLLPPPPKPKEQKDDKGAWYRSPWFWTGVGLVVVGGAGAGSYFMFESQSQAKNFSGEVSW